MSISLSRFAVVTPSDSEDVIDAGDWTHLIVGGAGAVAIDTAYASNVVLTLPAGVHPIRVRRVRLTGTTATALTLGAP